MTKEFLLLQVHHASIAASVVFQTKGVWRVRRDLAVLQQAEPGGDPAADNWAVRLRRALGDRRARLSCILLLHRQEYAVLQTELPPGTPDETTSMLDLILADLIPADSAGICSGWENVGLTETGQQIIQVYWTPQNKITPVLETLEAGGFVLAGVFPALAIFRRLLLAEDADRPLAFLHMTSESAEFACWRPGGTALFSRGRQLQSGSVAKNGSADTGLVRELASCLRNAQAQMALQANGGVRLVRLGSSVYSSSDCPACVLENHPAAERLKEATALYKSERQEDFLALAATAELAGTLLAQTHSGRLATPLNMLPRQFLRQHEMTRRRSLAIQTSTLILGIVLLVIGNLWLYSYQLEESLQKTQAEISQLAPQAKEIEAMEERIASIRDQIDYAISPTDALTQINRVLAESSALQGLFLDRMAYKSSGEIAMEGHSVSDITPWKFAEALSNTGLFGTVQRPKIETHMLGGTRSIRFALKVQTSKSSPTGESANEGKRR